MALQKNKKKKLRGMADRLWYRAYLKSFCEVCGINYQLQGHNFYYKGSYGHLRYLEENHITLCKKCHFVLHHQDPKKITDQIINKRGQEWYKKLRDISREKPASYQSIGYYQKVIELLK